MSLFGGSGFLGLGGSRLGEIATNVYEGAEEVFETARDTKLELPNKVIDYGEDLGNRTFDTTQETAEKFKQEAISFRSKQAGISTGRGLSGITNMLANNIPLILGAVGIWLVTKD